MTFQNKKVYFLLCDECPPEVPRTTSESADSLEQAQAEAIDDGWILDFDETGVAYDVCPSCVKRREQRKCGTRPEGHDWRERWFSGPADSDGWVYIDMGSASHWKRFCVTCHHSEIKYEAESSDAQ